MATIVSSDNSVLARTFIQESIKDSVYSGMEWIKQIMEKNVLKSKKWSWAENKFHMPIETAYNAAVGGRKEGSYVPPGGAGTVIAMKGRLKKWVGISNISWELETLQGAGDPWTENIIEKVESDLRHGFKWRMNCAMIGHKDTVYDDTDLSAELDVVAACDGASSGAETTITLEYHDGATAHSGATGNMYLMAGMPCYIGTASEIRAKTADLVTIVSKSDDKKTCVVTPATTWADGDLISPAADANGYSDAAIWGLERHINNAEVEYQELSRATYPQIKSNIYANSGTKRKLTEDMWDVAQAGPREYGNGGKVKLVLTSPAMCRVWKNLFRTYTKLDITEPIAAGKVDVQLGGFTPTEEPMMKPGWIFGIDPTRFLHIYAELFKIVPGPNGSIFREVYPGSATDGKEVRMHYFGNLVCPDPRAHFGIGDLLDLASDYAA